MTRFQTMGACSKSRRSNSDTSPLLRRDLLGSTLVSCRTTRGRVGSSVFGVDCTACAIIRRRLMKKSWLHGWRWESSPRWCHTIAHSTFSSLTDATSVHTPHCAALAAQSSDAAGGHDSHQFSTNPTHRRDDSRRDSTHWRHAHHPRSGGDRSISRARGTCDRTCRPAGPCDATSAVSRCTKSQPGVFAR